MPLKNELRSNVERQIKESGLKKRSKTLKTYTVKLYKEDVEDMREVMTEIGKCSLSAEIRELIYDWLRQKGRNI